MKSLKNNQKQLICFSIQELAALLLSEDYKSIVDLAVNNLHNLENAMESVLQLAKNSANSKDYEFWIGILSLYDEFERDCEFCFYLKDNINIKNISINNLADLEKVKQDPPDMVVYSKGQFTEFELKRYRGKLNENDLFEFIDKKILKHYSNPFNFLIILQPKLGIAISSFKLFKDLHERIVLKPTKRSFGKIALSFNYRNEEIIYVFIYPTFEIVKRPNAKANEQIKQIFIENS